MPSMNGIDLARRLRSQDIDAPIILITGYPDGSIPVKAASAGVQYVLLKPHLEESLAARSAAPLLLAGNLPGRLR